MGHWADQPLGFAAPGRREWAARWLDATVFFAVAVTPGTVGKLGETSGILGGDFRHP
jgi:hypothetical protein